MGYGLGGTREMQTNYVTVESVRIGWRGRETTQMRASCPNCGSSDYHEHIDESWKPIMFCWACGFEVEIGDAGNESNEG